METNITRQYISSEVRFYTISDLAKMLGWGEPTVQKLFNDPKFPAADFGKQKVVEAHALIDYFSTRHSKESDRCSGGGSTEMAWTYQHPYHT